VLRFGTKISNRGCEILDRLVLYRGSNIMGPGLLLKGLQLKSLIVVRGDPENRVQ